MDYKAFKEYSSKSNISLEATRLESLALRKGEVQVAYYFGNIIQEVARIMGQVDLKPHEREVPLLSSFGGLADWASLNKENHLAGEVYFFIRKFVTVKI